MKTSVIILHGWGLSGDTFLTLSNALVKKGYSVYCPDFPGFGSNTDIARPLYLDDYSEFLYKFITSRKIVSPVLIGHSFGGRVAIWFQSKYPRFTKALILSGTPGFTPVARKKIKLFILLAKVGKLFFNIPFLRSYAPIVRSWFYYVAGARDYYRANDLMKMTFKNIVQQDLESAMRLITIPTLLLWGKDDIICPIPVAKKMNTVIAQSEIEIIENTDHALPYKQAKLFSDRVDAFLQKI